MKRLIAFCFGLVVLVFSFCAIGYEDSVNAEKARSRQYNGGADEEDLKVQTQLAKDPKAKSSGVQEAAEGF